VNDLNGVCGIAVGAIRAALRDEHPPDLRAVDGTLARPGAAFVTLERDETLLGCVGTLEPVRPLALQIARHALDAAFTDPRVPAITCRDYETMSVKVSVLSRLQPLAVGSVEQLAAALRPGVDGVVVQLGARRATFLPSVWRKVSRVDDFLAALWHKAGLPPATWPSGMQASTYTAFEYSDAPPRRLAG